MLAQHYGNRKEDTFQGHVNAVNPVYTEDVYNAQFKLFLPQLSLLRYNQIEVTQILFYFLVGSYSS